VNIKLQTKINGSGDVSQVPVNVCGNLDRDGLLISNLKQIKYLYYAHLVERSYFLREHQNIR